MPERRRFALLALATGCSCCCCCCCCVQSVASLAGAAVMSRNHETDELRKTAVRSALTTYWVTVGVLVGALFSISGLLALLHEKDGALYLFIATLFFLPGLQLIASVFAWILSMSREPLMRKAAASALWRVTWVSVVCSVVGSFASGVLFFLVER